MRISELIGEEIYDEFDPQGHPDLSSYGSNDTKAPPVLKCKGSAPEFHTLPASLGPSSRVNDAAPNSSAYKPMATLKNLNFKGLTFARSRSAPPTPRKVDKELPAEVTALVEPEDIGPHSESVPQSPIEDSTEVHRGALPMLSAGPSSPVERVNTPVSERSTPKMKPATPVSVSVPTIRAPVPVPAVATPPAYNLAAAAASRSSSPSLEHAILMERKRRATSGNTAPVPKGARYKSSPLTGDRNGIVVAERVKRSLASTEEGDVDESRIHGGKEKNGPDKA